MKKQLLKIFLLLIFTTSQIFSQWEQIGDDLDGITNSSERFGRAVSISADGTVLAIGAYRDGESYDDTESLDERGSVRIYTKDASDTWVETAEITSNEIGGQLGRSLKLTADGNTLIIGAPNAGNGEILEETFGTFTFYSVSTTKKGLVRVYTNDGNNSWSQVGEDISGENDGDLLGWSVSISDDGNTIATGAYGYTNETGTAHIYEKDATNTWVKTTEFAGVDEGQRTGYSLSLSADGTTLAVGADKHDLEKGSTSVYTNNNGWAQVGLDIDGENDFENSGSSVSISEDGTTVAIGAYNYNNTQGTVRIYNYDNTSWVKSSQIDGNELDENGFGNEFGKHLYLTPNANTIVIGAPAYDFSNGLTRIYTQNDDASWTQKGEDILIGTTVSSFVFSATALSLSNDGNTVAIGAYSYNSTGGITNDGKVKVFEYADSSLSTNNITLNDITYSVQNQQIVVSSDDISLSIYDLLGRKTTNNNLNGIYIVRFLDETNGNSNTKKISIR